MVEKSIAFNIEAAINKCKYSSEFHDVRSLYFYDVIQLLFGVGAILCAHALLPTFFFVNGGDCIDEGYIFSIYHHI